MGLAKSFKFYKNDFSTVNKMVYNIDTSPKNRIQIQAANFTLMLCPSRFVFETSKVIYDLKLTTVITTCSDYKGLKCFLKEFSFPSCLGTDCEYDGIIIAMGTKYEDTTGPVCYKCSCSNTGGLDCCQ